MCAEREGEEGRGAGQNVCARSCIEATGGILAHFWGKRGWTWHGNGFVKVLNL